MRDNMCGWCDTCFCFRDVRRAVTAIGMFSLMTSAVQILVQIAVFTGTNEALKVQLENGEKEAITYQLYIALAVADVILVIFAIILLYGNERTDEVQGRKFLMPWVIVIPFYIIYECAINIYYFYHQFNDMYMTPLKEGHPLGFTIVPLVYWIVKDILLFIGFVFIIMRIQSLRPAVSYVSSDYDNDGCHECQGSATTIRATPAIHLPAPVSFAPAPVMGSCSSCNACSGNKCAGCNKPQPLYGYAGPQTSNVAKAGWTTNIYNHGR